VDALQQRVEVEARSSVAGTTISPSTTHRCGSEASSGASSSGKYRVNGRSLRLANSIASPSRKTMQRNPSHFGSYNQPSPTGISVANFASIGDSGGWRGNDIVGISSSMSGMPVPV
jgi:hypothetical protein